MLSLSFTGVVVQQLFNNITVPKANGSPPPPTTNGQVNGAFVTIDPYNSQIQWPDGTPSYLQGLAITSLTSPTSGITGSLKILGTFAISPTPGGLQTAEFGSIPTIAVYIRQDSIEVPGTFIFNSFNIATAFPIGGVGCLPYCNGSACPSANISLSKDPLRVVQVIPWNRCVLAGCGNENVTQFSMELQLTVTLEITCTAGDDLNSGFCNSYCLTQSSTNLEDCLPLFTDYCFQETSQPGTSGTITGPPLKQIQSNQNCRTFFSDYIQTVGPTEKIDNPLTQFCTTTYPGGFIQVFTNPEVPTDSEVCACHMQESQYEEFIQTLFQEFTGYGTTFGINERCLLPQCASSAFTTASIGKQCTLPNCLEIASITFNNNGSFDPNKITINQNNKGCTDVRKVTDGTGGGGNGGTGTGGTEQSFWDRYKWIIIASIVALVLLIIGIVLVAVV